MLISGRMPTEDTPTYRSRGLLRIFVPFLGSDLIEIIATLFRLARHIFSAKAHEGMYEVLNLDLRLELQDTKGRKAILYKTEKVRFLQDNIIAYQDKAWGDGEIFADYKCAPGVAVDHYKDGYRFNILISLRETKKRGDVEEFQIERTILGGFTKPMESVSTDIDHTTRNVSLSIVFPKKRVPKDVTLIEQNSTRTTTLGPQNMTALPDGRQQVTWQTAKPMLFENYILRCEW